ncbi:peptidase family C78-domain-containing protein [Spinellus fusiger]|nr:peptidase family C78-domain-containing protein [Spinellus fusiger]
MYLASHHTDHIATGNMDLGWGCGYRNCQILMSFLEQQQEQGEPVLKHTIHIAGLQRLLEHAWSHGFDTQGALQLDHQMYGTNKWIGTTDVFTILVYLGIRCTILDFHRPTGANNAHDALFDWIQSYFEEAVTDHSEEEKNKEERVGTIHPPHPTPSYLTDRPPLYLQHSGHSRTVIGIELLEDGHRNLIMFDPGRRMLRSHYMEETCSAVEDLIQEEWVSSVPRERKKESLCLTPLSEHSVIPSSLLRPFRVDAKTIARNKQYQLLVLGEVADHRSSGGKIGWEKEKGYLLTEQERDSMKKVFSIRAL